MKIRLFVFVNLFLLIYFLVIIVRDSTLSRVDCQGCRRFFSFIAKPEDYNKPIGVVVVNGRADEIVMFPKYVGWYSLSLFERNGELSSENQVKMASINCSPMLKHTILKSD